MKAEEFIKTFTKEEILDALFCKKCLNESAIRDLCVVLFEEKSDRLLKKMGQSTSRQKPKSLREFMQQQKNFEKLDRQQEKLMKIAKDKGLLIHSQNSGGIIYHGDFGGDIVRAGVILYGHYPNYPLEVPFDMKSVMTVKSVVSQLKTIPAGTQISYGRTYTAEKEMTVAVIPIGYADGYFRDFSSKGKMLINGVLCNVVGRVCMDQTIVDVSNVPDIKTGDIVYVYSDKCRETSVDYNASLIDTIGYELTCAVALRIPRVIIENGRVKEVVRYGLI